MGDEEKPKVSDQVSKDLVALARAKQQQIEYETKVLREKAKTTIDQSGAKPELEATTSKPHEVPVIGQYNHIHKTENDLVDSLEFGPAALRQKVYFNAKNPEEAKAKIESALKLMEFAAQELRNKGLDQAGKKGGA